MTDYEKREACISNLDQQIDWIEGIKAHQFPGWGHTVNAMRQALALLKEQEPIDGDTISRAALLAAYDAAHKGPPGGARKLIEEAPVMIPKGQEPVKPKVGHNIGHTWWYACGACSETIDPSDKFCRRCGRKVRWDE